MTSRPRRGPILAPPLDDDVVSAPSSLNTSIGGAYSTVDASPSFVRPQSKSLLRRGHNDEAERGGVSTAPRKKPAAPPPRRPSGPVGIAAPIDSYLLETQRNWGARIYPGQDLPHSDSDMASLDTSMAENETAGNVPSLKHNVINSTHLHQSSRNTQYYNTSRKGSGLTLSGGGGGMGAGRPPSYASPATEARDVMPLMESVALLDAAIRRNQKLLSSGEMPFKPCSIDHKAGHSGGTNGAASKRCTGNDLKEQLLETLVITERAIDRHYSCPSDLKILAGIAKGGGGGVRRQPHAGGDKQHQQGGGGASGFVWLQSPHALGPRNLNTVNNKPIPHGTGGQATSSPAQVPQHQPRPSREVPPQQTGTNQQQQQQPVEVAPQRKVVTVVKHHTTSAVLTEPSAKPSSAPVSTTLSGLQRRSHHQKESSMPPHTPISAMQQQQLPSVPSPLPVQPQYQQHRNEEEEEEDDDYDEPRLIL